MYKQYIGHFHHLAASLEETMDDPLYTLVVHIAASIAVAVLLIGAYCKRRILGSQAAGGVLGMMMFHFIYGVADVELYAQRYKHIMFAISFGIVQLSLVTMYLIDKRRCPQ